MKKRINSVIYTKGKFGKGWRETCDTDNPFLYSHGRYPTKITVEDLPEDYLKTSGIVDMKYTWMKENHLFKDDYIYISYKEPLQAEKNSWGHIKYTNYDVCVCGNDIVDIVLAAEKYSGFDTTEVRTEIEKKRVWLRDNEPEEYARAVGEDEDIFTLWKKKGYV